MAASGYMLGTTVKNLRDGELVISDGSTSPWTCTVTLDEGNFTVSEKKNVIMIKDRGTIHHMRAGDEEPITASFTIKYTGYYSKTSYTAHPYEILMQKGQCATGGDMATTSTTAGVASGDGDVYSVKLVMTYTDVDGSTETLTIDHFACTEATLTEGDETNTLAFSGICQDADIAVAGAAAP